MLLCTVDADAEEKVVDAAASLSSLKEAFPGTLGYGIMSYNSYLHTSTIMSTLHTLHFHLLRLEDTNTAKGKGGRSGKRKSGGSHDGEDGKV